MHLKRTHGAINKIISTDAIISDTGADELAHFEKCNTSANIFASVTRIENKEILENDEIDINFEEAKGFDNNNEIEITQEACDNQTIKSILVRDLAVMVSSILSDLVVPRKTAQFLIKSLSIFLTTSLTLVLQKWHDNTREDGTIDIDNILNTIRDSVSNFSSEFRRNKYYKTIGTLIWPQEYPIALENVEFFRGLRRQVIQVQGNLFHFDMFCKDFYQFLVFLQLLISI